MRSYTLLYSKVWMQVVSMIAIPVLTIIPFILILTQYKNLDNTIVFILICVALAAIILLTLYVVFKQAIVAAEITIHESEIEIRFEKKTLFNWASKKNISLTKVEAISDDEDVNYGMRKFFTIKLKNEWGKIMLMAPKKTSTEEMNSFSSELTNAIEKFNLQNQSLTPPIKQISFYTGAFAKTLTYILVAVVCIMTVIKIIDPSKIDWYRMVWIYLLAFSWFANFYTALKKRKT